MVCGYLRWRSKKGGGGGVQVLSLVRRHLESKNFTDTYILSYLYYIETDKRRKVDRYAVEKEEKREK